MIDFMFVDRKWEEAKKEALKCKRSLFEKIPNNQILTDMLSAWCLTRICKNENSTSVVEGSNASKVLDLSYQIEFLISNFSVAKNGIVGKQHS